MSAPIILPSGIFVSSDEVPSLAATTFTDIQVEAEGTFCCILRARRQGQWWCLKSLKEEYQGQPFYQGLLRKEYALLCRLNHSSVVRAVSLEPVDGVGECIVQEYVQGQTLDQVLGNRSDRRRWFEQIVEVVDYIHSQQVVHRDLKPQNIIVTDNGRNIKLIDFGLADADNFAELKQPAGTLRYVSPEQQKGGAADVRNDIYSLGVILRELQLGLTYRPIIRRCLTPIEHRYQNAEQLLRALHRVQHWPWVAFLAALTIVLLATVFYMSQHTSVESPLPSSEPPIEATSTPSISSEEKPQEVSTKDVPTIQQTVHPRRTTADAAYSAACVQVDTYMQEHHYSELLSTIEQEPPHPPYQGRSSLRRGELATALTQFTSDLWPAVAKIREGYAEQLGPTQSAALYTALVEYAQQKYTNALFEALQQYDQREQEYHRTLSAD